MKIHNFNKNETRDAKGALKKDEEYVFLLQFYVKDYSNALTNSFFKVVLCEKESKKGGFFKGIKPSDVLKNKNNSQEIVNKAIHELLRFNVWLEGNIEIREEEGCFILRDTELKEF